MKLYTECFFLRYQINPISPPDNSDQTILKDLMKQIGAVRLADVIRHYFKMNDPWYVQHAHSLSVLKRSLNAVNASTPHKSASTSHVGKEIQEIFYCDDCFVAFEGISPMKKDYSSVWIYCPSCKGQKNKSPILNYSFIRYINSNGSKENTLPKEG